MLSKVISTGETIFQDLVLQRQVLNESNRKGFLEPGNDAIVASKEEGG
jgi:hypothetical protein